MKIKNGKTKPRININAFRLYVKNTGNKKRFEIHDILANKTIENYYKNSRKARERLKKSAPIH